MARNESDEGCRWWNYGKCAYREDPYFCPGYSNWQGRWVSGCPHSRSTVKQCKYYLSKTDTTYDEEMRRKREMAGETPDKTGEGDGRAVPEVQQPCGDGIPGPDTVVSGGRGEMGGTEVEGEGADSSPAPQDTPAAETGLQGVGVRQPGDSGRDRFVPHSYQERAVRWIEDHPHCLLFLDMGLGKTVVTLTALQRLHDHAEIGRVLIVAPKKVAESTWHAEMGKWRHLHLRIALAIGDERHRTAAIESDADVVVMGRDNVVWLRAKYEHRKTFPFDTLVIDELTGFKSHSSARFRAVKWMRRHLSRIIGMTGTPVPNGLLDLWAQVYCIDGGERLDTFFSAYRSRWFDTVTHNNVVIKAWPKKGAEEEIMAAIADIALTMRSEDYLELPEMTEVDVPVTLPEVTLEWYRRFERDKIIDIKNKVGDMRKLTAESAAPLANKLAQYANGQVYDDERGVIETHDRKLDALREILEDDERPLLVFYQYRHDRDRIMTRFKGLKPRCYESDAELRDWNEGRIRLLLAHPASTAYGLNMQRGGHRIVWYSTGWNLELYKQANARLHRQGQREHVVVMRLVAKGTIDERMVGVLGDKENRQDGFLDDMKRYIRDYGKGQ